MVNNPFDKLSEEAKEGIHHKAKKTAWICGDIKKIIPIGSVIPGITNDALRVFVSMRIDMCKYLQLLDMPENESSDVTLTLCCYFTEAHELENICKKELQKIGKLREVSYAGGLSSMMRFSEREVRVTP